MKKKNILLLVFFFSMTYWENNSFALANKSRSIIRKIDIEKNRNYSFKPFSTNERITSLSIEGSISKDADDYLVRVILKDKEGNDHLIMEFYPEISEQEHIAFQNYGEETLNLNNVVPDSIKIFLKSATIHIDKIITTKELPGYSPDKLFEEKRNNNREKQLKNIVNKINSYNETHQKLWRAGVTTLSRKSYQEKKRILNFNDSCSTRGFEYYADGIYEIGQPNETTLNRTSIDSSYVDNFDWRNRHGINWMTSVKDQGSVNFCYPFATIGSIEAVTNLYYNQKLDLDLSEQELACCSGLRNPYHGTGYSEAHKLLDYLQTYGVCDEVAYPFVPGATSGTCRSDEITPNELVAINGYGNVYENEDSIKHALINHGPLVSGVYTTNWINHAMVMVGYGILHLGDTIYQYIDANGNWNGHYTVKEGDPHIGRTYFIYKNSCGPDAPGHLGGYMRVIHYNYPLSVIPTFYCLPPISTMNYNENDIVCSDADGDGYYYWGLGAKPASCPSWVPDTPDGDDSDINYGPMNEFGVLDSLTCGTTIKTPVVYSNNNSTSCRIGIVRGGTLTINGTLSLFENSKIRVCEEGTLIVDGGTIQNANLELIPGSTLIIRNNGVINMANGKVFDAPKGVFVNIESGIIN